MKKFICFIMVFTFVFLLTACGCEHSWNEATCTSPKTCSICGATKGGVSSVHNWNAATCTSPKTCSICGATEGGVSSVHNYVNNKCIDCNLVQLTLSNYEEYLDINATVKAGNSTYSSNYGYIYNCKM